MTKAESLLTNNAKDVFEWMKENPEKADAEVAAHFNFLARKEYQKRNPDPDIIYDPNRKKK